jgi:hypothetical protein
MRPLLAPLVAALMLLFAFTGLFTAAYHDPTPRDIPVAVVGSDSVARGVQSQFDRAAPGAFDVERYSSAAAARDDLLLTQVQGVFVPGERALVASAVGSAPTDAVRGAFEHAGAVDIVDVAPLPAHDSRGMSSTFTVIGIAVPSALFGAVLTLLGHGIAARARWLTIGAFAVLAGLLSAVTVDVLVGALSGAFWPLAAVSALLAFGVAAAVHGLGRSFGVPGIGVAVLAIVVLGNASSGGVVTPIFLPGFFDAVSGWLPPGAGITAVRNVVYFDAAAIGPPVLAMLGWAMAGVALDRLAGHRPRWAVGLPGRATPAPA